MDWKTVGVVLAIYLGVIGAATFYSNTETSSPTADTISGLPSVGSLAGSTGTTAAALDLAGAGVAWYFLVM